MTEEPEDKDGKSALEALHITRSDEWIKKGDEAVKDALAEEGVGIVFANMTHYILKTEFPRVSPLFEAIEPITEASVKLCRIFFQLGYYKGLATGEDREETHKLDKLMGGSHE